MERTEAAMSSHLDSLNSQQYLAYDELKRLLMDICTREKSGTLTLITDRREIASITFDVGDIINFSYCNKHGRQALEKFGNVKSAKCRFIEREALEKSQLEYCADLPTTIDTLRKLGIEVEDQASESRKILLVEDTLTARKAITAMLTKLGYSALEACSGEDAISVLETAKVDMILLDIIMPGMDGYETLNIIRKNPAFSNVPVVMLTSRDSLFDQVKGKLSKCNDYLTKPVTQDQLAKVITKHLKAN